MKEALNADTLFNTIVMVRQDIKQLLLVVEGDDDSFVLQRHSSDDCFVLPGSGGRPNVLRAARLAEQRSVGGVKFLVDTDFDRQIDPNRQYPRNVITSRHHDVFMDMIIISLSTVDRIIETHMRGVKRRKGSVESPSTVRDAAISLAATVIPLRIVNERKKLGLNLANFPFGQLPSLDPSPQVVAKLAIQRSNTTLTVAELVAEMENETCHDSINEITLIGDHDFFRALARVLAAHDARSISHDSLFNSFIDAITCLSIMKTEWYSSLSAWAQANNRSAFSCAVSN